MAQPDTPLRISDHAKKSLRKYTESCLQFLSYNWNLRSKMLEQDRIYQRTLDWTEAQRRAAVFNSMGDASKMQNVQVPVVAPQVESAHAFFVETFLSSYPIFPVISGPEMMDVAQQVDTIMGEAAVWCQYVKHLQMCFRDGLKYNLMAAEIDWVREKVWSVQTDPRKELVFGTPTEEYFSGNKIRHLNLYNTIVDMRVAPSEVHTRGEFAGYTEMISRIELKKLFLELNPLFTMDAEDAFKSNGAAYAATMGNEVTAAYYVPQVNPMALRDPLFSGTNWLTWAGLDTKNKIRYSDMYEKTVMYARIIPKEHGIHVQNGAVPQIFKFIIINRSVVIYVERKTNAHDWLPILVGQPIEDGLWYQTKSFADNSAPYQQLASALYNSAITSQRRKVYDRIFYDPSRIDKADIDNTKDVISRVPVKDQSYGKPVQDAYSVVPYRDEGVPQILSMAREVADMGDVSSGQNRVQRGQFQKGNKTRREFETVMDKSDQRPRTMAVVVESSWLQPMKYMLKMNILQFQPPAKLYNRATQQMVDIKPQDIRKVAWQFQVADGVLPVSRLVDPELLGQAFQLAASNPALAAEWDVMGMYTYSLQLQGATWVTKFRRTAEQQQQVIGLQQQMNGPPNGTATPGTTPALGAPQL